MARRGGRSAELAVLVVRLERDECARVHADAGRDDVTVAVLVVGQHPAAEVDRLAADVGELDPVRPAGRVARLHLVDADRRRAVVRGVRRRDGRVDEGRVVGGVCEYDALGDAGAAHVGGTRLVQRPAGGVDQCLGRREDPRLVGVTQPEREAVALEEREVAVRRRARCCPRCRRVGRVLVRARDLVDVARVGREDRRVVALGAAVVCEVEAADVDGGAAGVRQLDPVAERVAVRLDLADADRVVAGRGPGRAGIRAGGRPTRAVGDRRRLGEAAGAVGAAPPRRGEGASTRRRCRRWWRRRRG